MPTKLSRYAEGVMEAGWLAAIILAPLFFNVFSARIFEPDKITLLRSLALLMLAAWLVKLVDQGKLQWKIIPLEGSPIKTLAKIPLILPVSFLAFSYLVSTLFSVTPQASLWGSYQRLQGTYTTFTYLVFFLVMIGNLRSRVQVDRIITTLVVASLPVALYGVLQRYRLDPIPWGGDVSRRIASSMGNSIFVAAYLIMVFPLTLGRIIDAFRAILSEDRWLGLNVARAAVYVFIAVLQVVAIYMSGSRGPALGWLASCFFIVLLLTVWWRLRAATFVLIGLAAAIAAFLLVFNIEGGPLEALRTSPAIGRFGLLMNAESNSALVRRYIWEGAADMVAPHAPLQYPDGSQDRFNLIRPLVGYGPESMFVAYNPFYIPALGQVEKRNATPDRSHNETWDALVIGGVLGLIAYFWLFTSVFYFGLKWMGLVVGAVQRRLFFLLYIGGGLLGAITFGFWRGFEYLGVGIPFGILIGLILYIVMIAIQSAAGRTNIGLAAREQVSGIQFLTLMVLLASILAHFVEINFGIAIAVTRTYFWVYTALLLLVGYLLPRLGLYGRTEQVVSAEIAGHTGVYPIGGSDLAKNASSSSDSQAKTSNTQKKKKRPVSAIAKGTHTGKPSGFLDTYAEALSHAGLIAVILITAGYAFITNQQSVNNLLAIIWQSISQLGNGASSLGILALLLTTWLAGILLFVAEANRAIRNTQTAQNLSWVRNLLVILVASGVAAIVYWLWHAGGLASVARVVPQSMAELISQVVRIANGLARYYVYLFGLLAMIAFFLAGSLRGPERWGTGRGLAAALFGLATAIVLIINTNLQVIQADIAFKAAGDFNKPGAYPAAIEIYKRVNLLAPSEDYYSLYLGRAYLDQARSLTNLQEREQLFEQARDDLIKAQTINPLNTDHTANLARLYSLWATYQSEPTRRLELAQISDSYFSRAVVLSPSNVRLWNEWAYLALNFLDQPDQAQARLERAKAIDDSFDWTFGQLGDVQARLAERANDDVEKQRLLEEAVRLYQLALAMPGENQIKYTYHLALGNALTQLRRIEQAIATYEKALQISPGNPTNWRIQETLARLFAQIGDFEAARQYASAALGTAPEDQRPNLQALLDRLDTQP